MPLEPEAGEVWQWTGGQKYLLLREFSAAYTGKGLFTVLELATGSIKEMYFHQRDVGNIWIRVA